MKTILFYAANGVGLGHLRRTQLISEKLKKEKVEIILATSSLLPHRLGYFFNQLVRLIPLNDELMNNRSRMSFVRESNKMSMVKAVNKFKPDIIVSDIYLSNFSFYPLENILNEFSGKSAFIWRLSLSNPILELRKNISKLSFFNKIILPHSKDEILFFSPSFLKEIEKNSRFEIVGPIFKENNKKNFPTLKKKYDLSSKDFVLTVSFGAGGRLKGYCDSPDKIVKSFLNIYPELKKKIPNLKIILSTGPYFKKKFNKFYGMKFVEFEENLSELFSLSDLVISSSGYNTCNEIIQAKIPSILTPLKRGGDEQFKRAEYLKSKNICEILNEVSSNNLLKMILKTRKELDKMKKNFNKFSFQNGDRKTAKLILDL